MPWYIFQYSLRLPESPILELRVFALTPEAARLETEALARRRAGARGLGPLRQWWEEGEEESSPSS